MRRRIIFLHRVSYIYRRVYYKKYHAYEVTKNNASMYSIISVQYIVILYFLKL